MQALFRQRRTGWAADPVGEIAYGVSTLGLIIGEVVGRATGRSLDDPVRELIAEPLGLRLTRTPSDADLALTADLHLGSTMTGDELTVRYSADTLIGKALLMGDRSMADVVSEVWNTDTRRRTGNWSYAVHSDARSLARLAATLAGGGTPGGVRVVSEETQTRHLSRRRGSRRPGRAGTAARSAPCGAVPGRCPWHAGSPTQRRHRPAGRCCRRSGPQRWGRWRSASS